MEFLKVIAMFFFSSPFYNIKMLLIFLTVRDIIFASKYNLNTFVESISLSLFSFLIIVVVVVDSNKLILSCKI